MHEREHHRMRIQRLRAVVGELETLPRSPARDRLLREVHRRVVTVDTGEPSMSAWSEEPDNMLFQHMALQGTARFAGGR